MEDGQIGPNLVAVLNHVELELKSMSGLAQIQNQPMVVNHVQVQHPKPKIALLSTVQLMVVGQVGLNMEAVPNHVDLVSRDTFVLVLSLNLHMVVSHALEVQINTSTVIHISVHQNMTLTLDTKNQIENILMYGLMQCTFGNFTDLSQLQEQSDNGNSMPDAQEQFIFR